MRQGHTLNPPHHSEESGLVCPHTCKHPEPQTLNPKPLFEISRFENLQSIRTLRGFSFGKLWIKACDPKP